MSSALIALGTNLPHQGLGGPALLRQAGLELARAGLAPRALSGIWKTPPWPPGTDQPDYYNAVANLDPDGRSPPQLYQALREIEARFGRERRERWGPRTLDLDVLAIDGFVGMFGEMTLPHKRMHERAFVLAPLAEIAPDWRHPLLGLRPQEMLAQLDPEPTLRRLGDFQATSFG